MNFIMQEFKFDDKTETRKICEDCIDLHDFERFVVCDNEGCNCPCMEN